MHQRLVEIRLFSARTACGRLPTTCETLTILGIVQLMNCGFLFGAVHKVRHARGRRGSEMVWQFVTGGGDVESLWRHTYKKIYHTYETWNLKWCLTLCCNRSIFDEGEQTKTTSDKTFQTKTPWKNLANNCERICTEGFVRVSCTRPTENGEGSEMCDVLLGVVPRCVTKCGRGRGSKMAKNSTTYFMDGPFATNII